MFHVDNLTGSHIGATTFSRRSITTRTQNGNAVRIIIPRVAGVLIARNRFMESHDFVEGVRAVIIEKDNLPHWNPVRIDQVTQEYVQHYFVPFTDAKRELWATQIPKY